MRNVNSAADLRKFISEEKLPISVAKLDVDDDASVSDAFNKVLERYPNGLNRLGDSRIG